MFVSPDYESKDSLLCLIHGSGVVRAGQWTRKLLNNSLDHRVLTSLFETWQRTVDKETYHNSLDHQVLTSLIHGSGLVLVRAGQGARKLIINNSLDQVLTSLLETWLWCGQSRTVGKET